MKIWCWLCLSVIFIWTTFSTKMPIENEYSLEDQPPSYSVLTYSYSTPDNQSPPSYSALSKLNNPFYIDSKSIPFPSYGRLPRANSTCSWRSFLDFILDVQSVVNLNSFSSASIDGLQIEKSSQNISLSADQSTNEFILLYLSELSFHEYAYISYTNLVLKNFIFGLANSRCLSRVFLFATELQTVEFVDCSFDDSCICNLSSQENVLLDKLIADRKYVFSGEKDRKAFYYLFLSMCGEI